MYASTMKYYVSNLRHSGNGIDVYLSVHSIGPGDFKISKNEVITKVHPNIVRCALGESDMEYLLTASGESFNLTESDYNDFRKYRG